MKIDQEVMGKKGVIEGFSIVAFLIVIGSIGGVTYLLTQEEINDLADYKYVGDIESNSAYPIVCLQEIKRDNRVLFSDLEGVKKFEYNLKEECPK